MSLKNKKNTCGMPLSSTCVGYEGAYGGVLKEEEFVCDVNIDDVIYKLSTIIKTLDDEKNVSIESLKKDISELKEDVESIKKGDTYITMDLGCLTSGASPCEVSPKRYKLESILELFKNEICLLKSK